MLSDGMSEPMLQPGRRPRKERHWREAIVTSDAASTVGMLVANSGLLPVGRLRRSRPAGLFVFAFVATALYRLLKHASSAHQPLGPSSAGSVRSSSRPVPGQRQRGSPSHSVDLIDRGV